MDDDDYASHPKTGMKTPFKKSLVVALPTNTALAVSEAISG